MRCTRSLRVRVVPRVRVPNRSDTIVTTCPRFKAAGGRVGIPYDFKIRCRMLSISSRGMVRFLRSMLSRIVTLFPSPVVRVNKSRMGCSR